MSVPSLPLDIVVLVVANLWEDIASLKRCCTVCSLWLGATRPILFRSLYFTAEAIQVSNAPTSTSLTERLYDFDRFLDSAPEVRGMIKEFRVRKYTTRTFTTATIPLLVDIEVLLTVLSKLPVLDTVAFVGICCNELPIAPRLVCTSARTLVLKVLAHFSVDRNHQSKVIAHFPNVKHVQISNCYSNLTMQQETQVQDPSPSDVRLKSLEVTDSLPLAYWCNFHPDSLRSLQSLSLGLSWRTRSGSADIRVLKTMLHSAAEHLSHLKLRLDLNRDLSDILESDDLLTPCRSLRTLVFHLPLQSGTEHALEFLSKLLVQCGACQCLLQDLTISFESSISPYGVSHAAQPAWDTFQQVCSGLRSLQSVTIQQIYDPMNNLVDADMIRGMLPELDSRGLLVFRMES